MKNLLILVAGLFLLQTASAQEEAIFRQYFLNPMLVNPATVGADREHHNLSMNLRTAFSSFPGSPKTYALSYNGPIGKQVGIGGMIFSENIADITRFSGQIAYSMGIEINEDLKVRAGLSLEYQRMALSNSVMDTDLFDPGDMTTIDNINGRKFFDTSLGLYGEYKDIYFGYAAPNLIRTVTDEIEGLEDDGGNFKYFILQAGGRFAINDNKVKLEPSIILRNVRNVDTHVDVSMMASFLNEQFITGALFRAGAGNSVGFLLGTKYNTLKFIYSYDILIDDFQRYNGGSHEITVGFEFGRKEGSFDRSRKYRDK